MKNLFLLFACWTAYIPTWSQKKPPTLTIHAYYRESTPGIVRGNTGKENDAPSKSEAPKVRSWIIYAEYPVEKPVKIVALSFGKKTIPCRMEVVQGNEVLFQRPGFSNTMETDTLVPPTKNRIVRVVPLQPLTDIPTSPLPTVRIRYQFKGVTRFSSAASFRLLPPLLLQ